MLPFPGIGGSQPADIKIFRALGIEAGAAGANWQLWNKPGGKAHIYILGVGAGGGGGGGHTGAALSARGGGGGGGSGAVTTLYIPAIFVPDALYVRVGTGGLGVAADGNGGVGGRTWVSLIPNNNQRNLILRADEGGGGNGGTGAGAATAGSAGAASGQTAAPWSITGIIISAAGTTGSNGGGAAGGTPAALVFATGIAQGGLGGAGTTSADFAGGTYLTSSSFMDELTPTQAAAGSNDGSSGFTTYPPRYPFMSYGGSGGGASNAGIGGNGGKGGIGSGGGGGGGGTTGGRGGPGGDGIVYIISF